MDEHYKNFVERMGSFEDTLSIDGELQHYGILGMKWGRKKATAVPVEPSSSSQEHIRKVELKKKKLHELTNAELKVLNERMQLERTYKDLNKQDVSAGKQFARKVLTDIGTEAVKSLVKSTFTGEIGNNKYANSIKGAKIIKEAMNLGQDMLTRKPKWNEPA